MAIVTDAAEAYGRAAALESEVNAGSTVEMAMAIPTSPKSADSLQSHLQATPGQDSRKPHLRLLLVDDDPCFRDCTAEGLRADGHTVITAEDGVAAIQELESGSWDLVVTDYFMPRMDGACLAEESKRRNPSLRILMISGMERGSAKQVDGFLQKPFTRAQLWDAIRQCVDVSGWDPGCHQFARLA